MKMKAFLAVFTTMVVLGVQAFTVAVDTYVTNPGRWVTVPIRLATSINIAYVAVDITYDPEILVCMKVEEGSLGGEFSELSTSAGKLSMKVFLDAEQTVVTSELARITFFVRDGTEGKFSDVTISRVEAGDSSGVRDIFVDDPVTRVNGMVRSLATDTSAIKLESAFQVVPRSQLGSLTLAEGDGIIADADGEPIRVAGAVTADAKIPVSAPLGGWQTETYALLSTPTEGLSFTLEGASDAALYSKTTSGITTYYADVTVAGSVEVTGEEGTLSAATRAQIKDLLESELAAYPEVKSVSVKGSAALIPVAADLGIAPQLDVLGTTAMASYATPSLKIIAFEPKTGLVRIKVVPGEGNSIRAPLATGCLHAYGTRDLSQKMRFISGTSFDLSPYLQDATKGEADLTVALGSYTFIKIKAEIAIKQEGDEE